MTYEEYRQECLRDDPDTTEKFCKDCPELKDGKCVADEDYFCPLAFYRAWCFRGKIEKLMESK